MATESRKPDIDLIAALERSPESFEFFQAVRLIERAKSNPRLVGADKRLFPIGEDRAPTREVVRFRTTPSLTFASTPIRSVRPRRGEADAGAETALEMQVSFMGLAAAVGALPDTFTELILRRVRERDFAFQNFLDLFNHRLISLFYRAWEKYRTAFTWERRRLDPEADDTPSELMAALAGVASPSLRDRLNIPDSLLIYYAGHLSNASRNAEALARLVGDFLGTSVRIEQFRGRWLNLAPEDQTGLAGPGAGAAAAAHARLGVDTVCGARVWDIQSQFRLRVGPLDYPSFDALIGGGAGLTQLRDLVRIYVGPEYTFEVQLLLKGEDVPACQMGAEGYQPRLGLNTWLDGFPPERLAEDAIRRFEPFDDITVEVAA
jgi:type VI secretion system protein ImpH